MVSEGYKHLFCLEHKIPGNPKNMILRFRNRIKVAPAASLAFTRKPLQVLIKIIISLIAANVKHKSLKQPVKPHRPITLC